jgi:amidophosphoribosyltransferase
VLETCALDLIGATYVRDIEPGEVLVISDGGSRRSSLSPAPLSQCVFEHVYFAGPKLCLRPQRERRPHGSRPRASPASAGSTPTSSCRFPTPACAPATGYAEEASCRFAWA